MEKTAEELEVEYRKDSILKRHIVLDLLVWTREQSHFPKCTEFQIILFLKSCNYDSDLARVSIEKYFTLRTQSSDMFHVVDDADPRMLFYSLVTVLPERTKEGHVVLVSKLMDTSPELYTYVGYFRLFNMLILLDLIKNGSANGLVIIWDMEGSSFGHFLKTNWYTVKKSVQYLEHGAPYRLIATHYLHVNNYVRRSMQIIRPFVKKETLDMFIFHTTVDTLYDFIDRDMLPSDYGGKGPSCQKLHEEQKRIYYGNMEVFKWLDAQKIDESKRTVKIKHETNGNIVGKRGGLFRRSYRY